MGKRKIKKILYMFALSVLLIGVFSTCDNSDIKEESRENPINDIKPKIIYLENPTQIYDVSVVFINVGRADATLIKVGELAYLIDTGEKSSIISLFQALAICEIDKVEAVFLTHTHSDHIGGMKALSKKYEIDKIYSSVISENKKNGENKIEELAKDLSISHEKLKIGDIVKINKDINFEVLGPIKYNKSDDNDNSLVVRMTVKDKSFLFVGDMQFAEERSLLKEGIDLSADVLLVGNHGNPDATSKQFAEAVSPNVAVISTDVKEDKNSASERVIKVLGASDVYVTSDFSYGVLMNAGDDNVFYVSDLPSKKSEADIEITKIDKEMQTITIINNGDDADISDYFIVSDKGSELFVFDKNTIINHEQMLTIACTGGSGDLIWDDENVWHEEKKDIGILYDCYANEISRME
jgi:competence protein ComEC